jgi:hypothetical protein
MSVYCYRIFAVLLIAAVIACVVVHVEHSRKMKAQGKILVAPVRKRLVFAIALIFMLIIAAALFMQTFDADELSPSDLARDAGKIIPVLLFLFWGYGGVRFKKNRENEAYKNGPER